MTQNRLFVVDLCGRTNWWLSSADSNNANNACNVNNDGNANSNQCTNAGIRVPL